MEPALTANTADRSGTNPHDEARPPRGSRPAMIVITALVAFAAIFSFYLYGMVLSLEEDARAAKEARVSIDAALRFPDDK